MERASWWRPRRINLRRTRRIEASAERVYAALADVRARPSWMPELRSADAPERPVGEGDRFRGESRLLLHQFLGESVVLTAEGPVHLEEEVIIGARFRTSWTIEPVGDHAEVRYDIELDYPGGPLGRVERWILRRRLLGMQSHSLRRLAMALESQSESR